MKMNGLQSYNPCVASPGCAEIRYRGRTTPMALRITPHLSHHHFVSLMLFVIITNLFCLQVCTRKYTSYKLSTAVGKPQVLYLHLKSLSTLYYF